MSPAPELSRVMKASDIGASPRGLTIEATAVERDGLAARFALLSLDVLAAELSVWSEAAGVRVTGRVRAEATQACVVSAEPVPATVDAPLDLLFAVEGDDLPEEVELSSEACDVLPFDGQAIDVGEAVAQTFGLALDPYPRAAGPAAQEARSFLMSEEEAVAAQSPFAALKQP